VTLTERVAVVEKADHRGNNFEKDDCHINVENDTTYLSKICSLAKYSI
jgi:hypothetical protein